VPALLLALLEAAPDRARVLEEGLMLFCFVTVDFITVDFISGFALMTEPGLCRRVLFKSLFCKHDHGFAFRPVNVL